MAVQFINKGSRSGNRIFVNTFCMKNCGNKDGNVLHNTTGTSEQVKPLFPHSFSQGSSLHGTECPLGLIFVSILSQ